MKMKINKACDLSSLSVLPPNTRRSNTVPSGSQASQLRSQPSVPSQQSFSQGLSSQHALLSQLRSQPSVPSQQSFSQGLSSQHALLSQLSQNSLDEVVTIDQRLDSQERGNSMKRLSCMPSLTYAREESQPPNSRSSANPMRKWNSVDHKSQLSEGIEHRIGIMETSLNKLALILDSIQSDVMQVNKGTKEVTLEMEYMRQKLNAQDNTLQLMTRGQEEIKASIDGSLKSLSDQVSKVTSQEMLQKTFSAVSTLPQLIEASLQNLQKELYNNFSKEMQVISCSLQSLNRKDMVPSIISPKSTSKPVAIPEKPQVLAKEVKIIQATKTPKIETGGWKTVKKVAFSDRLSKKEHKQKGLHTEKHIREETECIFIIESDEETDGSFSCLAETDLYGNWSNEAIEETERILREARRRKRKHSRAGPISDQVKGNGEPAQKRKPRIKTKPSKYKDYLVTLPKRRQNASK